MLGEGGELRFDININFLLEDYGIMVNNGKYIYYCSRVFFVLLKEQL